MVQQGKEGTERRGFPTRDSFTLLPAPELKIDQSKGDQLKISNLMTNHHAHSQPPLAQLNTNLKSLSANLAKAKSELELERVSTR